MAKEKPVNVEKREVVKKSPLDPGNFTGIDEWYEAKTQLEKK
jgi:hypothetical protein